MKKLRFVALLIICLVIATSVVYADDLGEVSEGTDLGSDTSVCSDDNVQLQEDMEIDINQDAITEEEATLDEGLLVDEELPGGEDDLVQDDIPETEGVTELTESVEAEEVSEIITVSITKSESGAVTSNEQQDGWSSDGTKYYKNGEKQVGFVEIDGVTYYFNKKGILVINSEEHLFADEDGVYHYVNKKGIADPNYSGLANSKTNQYYVKDGIIDTSYKGLARSREDKNIYYHVWNGKVNRNYSGLSQSVSKWYYVSNGVYDKTNANYNGFAKTYESDKIYLVEDSTVNKTYQGLVRNNNNPDEYYHVWNGKFNPGYTGLSKSVSNWYFVRDGIYNKTQADYNGPAQSYKSKAWYHVESSKMRKKTGESTTELDGVTYNYHFNEGRINDSVFVYDDMIYYGDDSGFIKTEAGVIQTYDDAYYYVKPETGKVRRNAGFIKDSDGERRYITQGGKLLQADTLAIDGKTYGATSEAILAKSGWVKTGDYYLYYTDYDANAVSIKAREIIIDNSFDLRSAYAYCRDLPYYRIMGDLSRNGSMWCADYLFTNKRGNCYCISGGFWCLAQVLGHQEIKHVAGSVNGGAIHGWCEVIEDGVAYVYDPTGDRNKSDFSLYHTRYRDQSRYSYDSGHKSVAI